MTAIRLPIVGVMGSGSVEHVERAEPLGRWLAGERVHLLTGGGGGVMSAVSRAFHEISDRAGLVIGVIPGSEDDPETLTRRGYPNRWVEITIRTHLPLSGERGTEPLSRNHVNVLSADVTVALPGGPGTASEVALAARYRRPLVAFVAGRADIPGLPDAVPVEDDIEGVKAFVLAHLPGSQRP